MAGTVIRFEVLGAAKPQGSKRGFVVRRRDGSHGVAIAESCREVKSWRQQVAAQAYAAKRGGPLIAGPVEIEMHFFRVRPKTHYGSGKNATKIKPKSPRYPIAAPDVDKLARAVNDALKGVVWRDDSQVVRQVACKHWGNVDRCEIVIREVAAEQEAASVMLVSYLMNVSRENAGDWLVGLVDEVNAWAKATGERDRIELCGDDAPGVREGRSA